MQFSNRSARAGFFFYYRDGVRTGFDHLNNAVDCRSDGCWYAVLIDRTKIWGGRAMRRHMKTKGIRVPGPSRWFLGVYFFLTLLLGVIVAGLALRAFNYDDETPRVQLMWFALLLAPLAGLLFLSPMLRRFLAERRAFHERMAERTTYEGLDQPICPKCSYDLTSMGPSGRCPECGGFFQFSSMLTHQFGKHAKGSAEPPPAARDGFCQACGQDFRGHRSSSTCFNCGRPR